MAKIAKAILLDPVTETIDLAKLSTTNANELVNTVFKEPFQLDSQIRLTFIVGAGKAGRQKYDPALTKTLCAALENLGFNQDPGASCVNSCQGKFKHQHDTGQNLMYLHVFPKFEMVATSTAETAVATTAKKTSPDNVIITCDLKEYEEILERRCDTWIQRKRSLLVLEATDKRLQEIENKLCKGTPIAAEDQTFYDEIDREELQKKLKATTNGMKVLVKSQAIDRVSKEFLLGQIDKKISGFETQLKVSGDATSTTTELSPVQKDAMQKKMDSLKERRLMIDSISPINSPELSNDREMYSLWINILKLKKEKKDSKEQELHFNDLARESKRWFEEDSELAARVANLKTRAKARTKTPKQTGSGKKKKKKSQGRAPGTGSRSRKKAGYYD